MTVTCSGGKVVVNGSPPFTLGCNEVDRILITGNGGTHTVNLSGVTPTDFSTLTGALIDGGPGTDVINGSQARGGAGDDLFENLFSLEPLNGGPGYDTVSFPLPAAAPLTATIGVDDTGLTTEVPPAAPQRVPWSSIDLLKTKLTDVGTQTVTHPVSAAISKSTGEEGPTYSTEAEAKTS